ncbi:MAG TPA: sigma 54-interacting transcriptional regulator [Vicinamibacterales bacterium]
MTRLLHDRYYAYADAHAWDLATGVAVRVSGLKDARPDDVSGAVLVQPAPPALTEVLDHGREGHPRWLILEGPAADRPLIIERAATAARDRGFVPVAADVYLRLRHLLREELQHRSLFLILRPGLSIETGRAALIDAASRSPRPHLLVSFSDAVTVAAAIDRVREARAHYSVETVRQVAPAALKEDVLRHMARGAKADEFVHAGRHASADRLLRDVAGALIRRGALAPAAQALISLGRLVLERGRAADAERIFDEASGHARDGRDEALSLTARIWQAAARTDNAQLTAAESLCRATLVTGGLPSGERTRANATLARILLWQGRVDDAATLDVSGASGDDDSRAFVEATAIRLLLACGSIFEAGGRARVLLTDTGQSGRPLARVLALMAHLRVLSVTGDLVAMADRLTDLEQAAREARAPLRLARARLLVAQTLRAAGRTAEAEALFTRLRRMGAVAPPLLRNAIDGHVEAASARSRCRVAGVADRSAIPIVTLAQEKEDDRDAVRGILQFVAESVQACRVDLCSMDAGPVSAVLTIGSGMPTALGQRVLEAGITIEAGQGAGGELGVPVRLGPRLVAAIVTRWPADRHRPDRCRDLLELAAAIAAPRIDAMRATARHAATTAAAIPELVGASEGIADVRRTVARAASAPFAVLIEGESGVGKELVARAIHQLSPRRERRFCDLNCAALPDDLLESELFGHARGAFTGAVAERAGLIEEADGGTLFLDEVTDLSPRAQAKLLRVLQQQEVRRVGESFSRKVDVRVVSAANRDVHGEAAASRFRSDLLYRLDVIRIRVPALRERPEDIPLLAHHFWAMVAPRVDTRAVLTHGLITALSQYHWPGNVRELQNVMSALAVAAPSRGQVRASLLPHAITGVAVTTSTRLSDARQQFERRFIEAALARAGGRRTRAARDLGLSRQGLLKIMTRLGVDKPRFDL